MDAADAPGSAVRTALAPVHASTTARKTNKPRQSIGPRRVSFAAQTKVRLFDKENWQNSSVADSLRPLVAKAGASPDTPDTPAQPVQLPTLSPGLQTAVPATPADEGEPMDVVGDSDDDNDDDEDGAQDDDAAREFDAEQRKRLSFSGAEFAAEPAAPVMPAPTSADIDLLTFASPAPATSSTLKRQSIAMDASPAPAPAHDSRLSFGGLLLESRRASFAPGAATEASKRPRLSMGVDMDMTQTVGAAVTDPDALLDLNNIDVGVPVDEDEDTYVNDEDNDDNAAGDDLDLTDMQGGVVAAAVIALASQTVPAPAPAPADDIDLTEMLGGVVQAAVAAAAEADVSAPVEYTQMVGRVIVEAETFDGLELTPVRGAAPLPAGDDDSLEYTKMLGAPVASMPPTPAPATHAPATPAGVTAEDGLEYTKMLGSQTPIPSVPATPVATTPAPATPAAAIEDKSLEYTQMVGAHTPVASVPATPAHQDESLEYTKMVGRSSDAASVQSDPASAPMTPATPALPASTDDMELSPIVQQFEASAGEAQLPVDVPAPVEVELSVEIKLPVEANLPLVPATPIALPLAPATPVAPSPAAPAEDAHAPTDEDDAMDVDQPQVAAPQPPTPKSALRVLSAALSPASPLTLENLTERLSRLSKTPVAARLSSLTFPSASSLALPPPPLAAIAASLPAVPEPVTAVPTPQLQAFLEASGVRFWDDAPTSTRRETLLPPAFAAQPLESLDQYAVAACITAPERDMLKHGCEILMGAAGESREAIAGLENALNTYPPSIFAAVLNSADEHAMQRVKNAKTVARLHARQAWYMWRTKLVTSLGNDIETAAAEMQRVKTDLDGFTARMDAIDAQLASQAKQLQQRREAIATRKAAAETSAREAEERRHKAAEARAEQLRLHAARKAQMEEQAAAEAHAAWEVAKRQAELAAIKHSPSDVDAAKALLQNAYEQVAWRVVHVGSKRVEVSFEDRLSVELVHPGATGSLIISPVLQALPNGESSDVFHLLAGAAAMSRARTPFSLGVLKSALNEISPLVASLHELEREVAVMGKFFETRCSTGAAATGERAPWVVVSTRVANGAHGAVTLRFRFVHTDVYPQGTLNVTMLKHFGQISERELADAVCRTREGPHRLLRICDEVHRLLAAASPQRALVVMQ